MNTNERHSLDRGMAEQLLDGAPIASRPARVRAERLAECLADAAAPAFGHEFAGERVAVAAFRSAAWLSAVSQSRRESMIRTTLAKLLTLKAAAILATVSAGGVALAATTGVLPNPLSQDPPAPHSTPSDNPGQGNPSPSLKGLCTAFLAGAGSEHGAALDSPAFTALITAAGGRDKVESYCTALVADGPQKPSAGHPTGPPTSLPGHAPTPHPTGAPATHPTGPQAGGNPTPSHPGS